MGRYRTHWLPWGRLADAVRTGTAPARAGTRRPRRTGLELVKAEAPGELRTEMRSLALRHIVERGRANVQHYHSASGEQVVAIVDSGIRARPDAVRDAVKAYAELKVDELIFIPALAEVVR